METAVTNHSVLTAMVANFPNGTINVFDRDLRHMVATGRGFEKLPVNPANLIGRRLQDLMSSDAFNKVESLYKRAFLGEKIDFDFAMFGRRYASNCCATPL